MLTYYITLEQFFQTEQVDVAEVIIFNSFFQKQTVKFHFLPTFEKEFGILSVQIVHTHKAVL